MSMFAGDLSSKYLRQGYGMPTSSLRNQPTQAGMGVSSVIKQPLRNTGGRGSPNLRETSAYKQGLTGNIDQNMGGYVNPSLFSDPNLGQPRLLEGLPSPTGGGFPIGGGSAMGDRQREMQKNNSTPNYFPNGREPVTNMPMPQQPPQQSNNYQTNVDFMNQMAQQNAQVGSDGSSVFPTFSYDPKTNQYMRDSSAFGLTGDAANTYYSPEDFQSEFGRTLGKMPSQGGGDQGPIGTGVSASDVPAFNPSYNSGITGGMQLGQPQGGGGAGIYQGGSKGFYDRNPGQLLDPASLYSDPNLGQPQGRDQGPIGTGIPASDVFMDEETRKRVESSGRFGYGGQGPLGTGVPASDVPAFDPSYNSGVTGGMQLGQPQGGGGNNFGFTRGDGIGTQAMVPWENPDTGETYMAPSGAYSPPEGSSWVRSSMGGLGGFGEHINSSGQTGIANDPTLTGGSGYFDTSGGANTYGQTPTGQAGGGLNYSGMSPSTGGLDTGMALAGLGGLLTGGSLQDFLGTLGGYYRGKEGIEAAYGTGEAGFNLAEQIGQRAAEGSQFKPYTVTSNLAQVQTDPRGGYNVNLSPQQQALQNQALGQAGQFFGQVGSYDPSIAAQRGAMGGLFGQSLGQYGQPTGLEGLTQAGISGAEGYLGSAGQPSDIEALRAQYAGLAGQAGQGLLMSPEDRQANIYESIRATQTPEEQRQRLALEERMLAQGRTGVSSDAYGGASPELLAMETARQEAMARAGLSARQQAMAEQQQGLATAQSLTGLTTGLAGTSSDLETAGIGRGTALANLGLAGTQASNTMGRQQLEDLLSLQRSDISSAQLQQALQQGRLGLGTGMLQAGYMPQQQALEMLRQSQVPAQYASAGRLQGADLQAQLGGRGIESLMQGSQLANELRQQQLAASLQSVLGAQSPTTGSFGGGLLEKLFGGSGGEYDWLPDWIGNPVYSDLEDETDEYDDYYDYDGGE